MAGEHSAARDARTRPARVHPNPPFFQSNFFRSEPCFTPVNARSSFVDCGISSPRVQRCSETGTSSLIIPKPSRHLFLRRAGHTFGCFPSRNLIVVFRVPTSPIPISAKLAVHLSCLRRDKHALDDAIMEGSVLFCSPHDLWFLRMFRLLFLLCFIAVRCDSPQITA